MQDPNEFVEHLEHLGHEIVTATGPTEVFSRLLDAFAACAPRAAILLHRKGALRGWHAAGYDDAAAARLRETTLSPGEGWPGRLASAGSPDRTFRSADEAEPVLRLEDRERHESLGAALRVGGRTLAVLIAERDAGESPWSPPAMGLLLDLAHMRLEVDLARRRLARVGSSPETTTAPAETTAPAKPEETAQVAPPEPTDDSTAIEERPADPGAAPRPEDEPARRFARLVATDIRLYNEEDVVVGRREGDLATRLGESIQRGRETFERRFPDLGDRGVAILHDAMVQVLAAGDRSLLPASCLTEPGGGAHP